MVSGTAGVASDLRIRINRGPEVLGLGFGAWILGFRVLGLGLGFRV